MATISDFYPYIFPEVPGCPDFSVDVAVRAALVEFCEKSLIIQRDHDPITVVKGIIDYDLEPPNNQLVSKVMKAWYKNVELEAISPDNVDQSSIYNSIFTGASVPYAEPRAYLQKDERTITIYPFPKDAAANALTLRVALKPTRKADVVEDVLYEDYAEIVASGAKVRLFSMSGKSWTNGPAAAFSLTRFNEGINLARTRAMTGGTRGEVRVRLTGV